MEVVATQRGHDGKVVREPGEKFEMPEGSKATWFEPTEPRKGRRPKEASTEV